MCIRDRVDPALSVSIFERFNPDALLIGFGRRFATYKSCLLYTSALGQIDDALNGVDADKKMKAKVRRVRKSWLEQLKKYESQGKILDGRKDVYKRQDIC